MVVRVVEMENQLPPKEEEYQVRDIVEALQ
jgi:hypothetical protein